GCRADRAGMGRADGAAGIRPLRRGRQRLGDERQRQHHPAGPAARRRRAASAPLAPPLPDTGRAGWGQPSDDGGYSLEQRTRPQTIGYSLTDSPAGLAAWIVEKVSSWTDPRSRLARDAVLDNVMHYWLPRTGASAARLYWESLSDVSRWLEGPLEDRDLVHAPVGCSVFPYELQRPTRHEA